MNYLSNFKDMMKNNQLSPFTWVNPLTLRALVLSVLILGLTPTAVFAPPPDDEVEQARVRENNQTHQHPRAENDFTAILDKATSYAMETRSRTVTIEHVAYALFHHLSDASSSSDLAGLAERFKLASHLSMHDLVRDLSEAAKSQNADVDWFANPAEGESTSERQRPDLRSKKPDFDTALIQMIDRMEAHRESVKDPSLRQTHLLYDLLGKDESSRAHMLVNQSDLVKEDKALSQDKLTEIWKKGAEAGDEISKFTYPLADSEIEALGRNRTIRGDLKDFASGTEVSTAIVGKPQSGKTIVLQSFQQQCREGKFGEELTNKTILVLDPVSLTGGTKMQGALQERLNNLFNLLEESPEKYVLYVPNVQHLLKNDGGDSGNDNYKELWSVLNFRAQKGRAKFKVIYETDSDGLDKLVSQGLVADKGNIVLPDLDEGRLELIIDRLIPQLEKRHSITISDSVSEDAIDLAKRFITDRGQVGAIVQLLDKSIEVYKKQNDVDPIGIESENLEVLENQSVRASRRVQAAIQNHLWRFSGHADFENLPNTLDTEKLSDISEVDAAKCIEYFKPLMALTEGGISDDARSLVRDFMRELVPALFELNTFDESHDELERFLANKEAAIRRSQEIHSEIDTLRSGGQSGNERLDELQKELRGIQSEFHVGYQRLTGSHLAEAITRISPDIPAYRVTPYLSGTTSSNAEAALEQLETLMRDGVKGQGHIIDAILKREKQLSGAGMENTGVRAAYLIPGDSGIGKTLIAQVFAEALMGSREKLIKLNMSEYKSPEQALNALRGAAAGYAGYGNDGALTGPLKKHPHGVLLLDEVNQAHPEVLQLLYQILEDGEITNGKGEVIDCSNITVIMTTNAEREFLRMINYFDDFNVTLEEGKPLSEQLTEKAYKIFEVLAKQSGDLDKEAPTEEVEARMKELVEKMSDLKLSAEDIQLIMRNQYLKEGYSARDGHLQELAELANTAVQYEKMQAGNFEPSSTEKLVIDAPLLGRNVELLPAKPLTLEVVKEIVRVELKRAMKRSIRLGGRERRRINLDEAVAEHLSRIGFDELLGARPIKNTYVPALLEALIPTYAHDFHPGSEIKIRMSSDNQRIEYFSEDCNQVLTQVGAANLAPIGM